MATESVATQSKFAPFFLPFDCVNRAGLLGARAQALANVIGFSSSTVGDGIGRNDIVELCYLLAEMVQELQSIAETRRPMPAQEAQA
ncbi:MAG: hypothetical protein EPN38_08525 [Rhodanobacteraceae bacterium]|nr:MAG: hypothetical protein EPN38_08525 [Rhodanobacteraceae bacterium]